MKLTLGAVALGWSLMVFGQAPVITSFGQNGQLVCTNLAAGSVAAVEWASTPSGPWKTNWTGLDAVTVNTNDTITVGVPMFYRVRGTPASVLLSSSPAGLWNLLTGRMINITDYVAPTFQANSIDWSLPLPANANRGDIASKTSFLADTIRFDFEYYWTGGGTIELLVCDAADLNSTNWIPGEYYDAYISSVDTPFSQVHLGDSSGAQIYSSSQLESSSLYKNAWVTNSITKNGSTWKFYRNNNLLNTVTFTNLNGKPLGLIVSPSDNYYKGSGLNVSFRKIQATVP